MSFLVQDFRGDIAKGTSEGMELFVRGMQVFRAEDVACQLTQRTSFNEVINEVRWTSHSEINNDYIAVIIFDSIQYIFWSTININ